MVPQRFYLSISKLHSILVVVNLLAQNNITINPYVNVLRNGQLNTFGGIIYFAVLCTFQRLALYFDLTEGICQNDAFFVSQI